MERIQKILAAGGIASRRAAEKLITEGRVRVNGQIVSELGAKADPRQDRIEVDGKRVVAEHHVYLVLHKPRGVVATMSDPEGRPTVRDILAPVGARVYPVGRLDFATSGVLLATNDGDFAEGLLHPKRAVPKTYVVKVNGKMKAEDMDRWRDGVQLEDGMTQRAEAKTLRFEGDKTWFELTIKEGRNQQIRRMGEATGFPVMRLARLAFAQITAEGLRPGEWRHMTREELVQLKKTYGVPKSIPAPPEKPTTNTRRTRAPHPERGRRAPTPQGEERGRRAPTPPGEERGRRGPPAREGRTTPAPAARGPNTHRSSGRGSSIRSEGTATRDGGASGASGGPRYGGGAPGRRGNDATEDWGGGARRGSSSGNPRNEGGRGQQQQPKPRPDLGGGRGGRTRTTGTAGGVGTSRDADRVKGRRGR
jgi:23S rRNA pseudouridine2605 synthase